MSSGFIESMERWVNWNTLSNCILEGLKFVQLACADIKEKIIAVVKER